MVYKEKIQFHSCAFEEEKPLGNNVHNSWLCRFFNDK